MRVRLFPLVLFFGALGACQPSAPGTPTPTVLPTTTAPTTEAPPSPTPTPSAEPTFEGEKRAIYEGAKAYLETYERLSRDPESMGMDDVPRVAIGTAAVNLRTLILKQIEGDRRMLGDPKHSSISIGDPTVVNGSTTATVTFCSDLTEIQFVNKAGTPVSLPDRPMYISQTMTLQKMVNGEWMTSLLTGKRAIGC